MLVNLDWLYFLEKYFRANARYKMSRMKEGSQKKAPTSIAKGFMPLRTLTGSVLGVE